METTGRIKGFSRDWDSNKPCITFELDSVPHTLDDLQGKTLNITAKPYRNKRSLNANALLWKCIGDIAGVLRTNKWTIYLKMLREYGEYTYVCVKPKAVNMLKRQWRECEEIGVIDINGTPAVQMLCYYGSSTYDTKQFSKLLDGVFTEMENLGLESPTQEQLKLSLEAWNEVDHTKRA